MLAETDKQPIRILLIDDHEIFLAGLRSLLNAEPGMTVIASARNRCEALLAASTQPDIILMDLRLANESTVVFFPELISVCGRGRILVLTGISDIDQYLQAVSNGAMGVVNRQETSDTLIKAIRKVHEGEMWLNRSVMASAVSKIQSRQPKPDPTSIKIASLTVRELDVISILGEGRRNREIGERLFISEKTVRHYLTSIFNKLEVEDRLELMIFSYQHGLAEVPSRQRA